eukprot:scaffold63665_cov67-Phaeocystis_antarctica.AAC.2
MEPRAVRLSIPTRPSTRIPTRPSAAQLLPAAGSTRATPRTSAPPPPAGSYKLRSFGAPRCECAATHQREQHRACQRLDYHHLLGRTGFGAQRGGDRRCRCLRGRWGFPSAAAAGTPARRSVRHSRRRVDPSRP